LPAALPRPAGWEFAAACRPAGPVSGDYHDLFALYPGLVAVALGDVSGKGVGAALVTAGLHALVRARLPHQTADLTGLMGEINRYLVASTPQDVFVTLFLSVLETGSGRLRLVNAGHPSPVLVDAAGKVGRRLTRPGHVLGVLPEAAFDEEEIRLEPGDLLALFSDGVVEAQAPGGEMFHERRVGEVLCGARSCPATAVVSRMLEAVEQFLQDTPATDDISVVVVRRERASVCPQRSASRCQVSAVSGRRPPQEQEPFSPLEWLTADR
jgi:sigma-B regulation protein RsbU (phosphoserine phosphatase)